MNEEQFEDALHSWPLAELPPGFSKDVMNRIKPRQPQTRVSQEGTLKFHLTWIDFALSIFFSLLPVIGFLAYVSLPRKLSLYLQYQWLLLQSPAYQPVMFALLAAGVMLFLIFLLSLRYILPRRMNTF
jgi:hypothetical protein